MRWNFSFHTLNNQLYVAGLWCCDDFKKTKKYSHRIVEEETAVALKIDTFQLNTGVQFLFSRALIFKVILSQILHCCFMTIASSFAFCNIFFLEVKSSKDYFFFALVTFHTFNHPMLALN